MKRRLLLVPILCLMACGDGEDKGQTEKIPVKTYEVRGEFLGPRFKGAAMKVRHEEIPGLMKSMAMDFKLKNPEEIKNLSPGDKIRFQYVITADDAYSQGISTLPPETELRLGKKTP